MDKATQQALGQMRKTWYVWQMNALKTRTRDSTKERLLEEFVLACDRFVRAYYRWQKKQSYHE